MGPLAGVRPPVQSRPVSTRLPGSSTVDSLSPGVSVTCHFLHYRRAHGKPLYYRCRHVRTTTSSSHKNAPVYCSFTIRIPVHCYELKYAGFAFFRNGVGKFVRKQLETLFRRGSFFKDVHFQTTQRQCTQHARLGGDGPLRSGDPKTLSPNLAQPD